MRRMPLFRKTKGEATGAKTPVSSAPGQSKKDVSNELEDLRKRRVELEA